MPTHATSATPPTALEGVALEQRYEHADTRALVSLVTDAAELVRTDGESAFTELRRDDSRWRRSETYVFVLDPDGNMLVHPDPVLEAKNQLGLKDIAGKPIIKGLIQAATRHPARPEGWFHYQWPIPGDLIPRWKSSYVRLVRAPSGKPYIVGAGMYNDRMERAFVEEMVQNAVAEIETHGTWVFQTFRDPTGPFIAKDAYIFVFDMKGIELLNVAFPNLEGRDLIDLADTHGKKLVRQMIALVQTSGFGWVDYMWPKPGQSVSTQKSAYVTGATMGGTPVLVGCGVYLADAPREPIPAVKMTAPQLLALVREGAAVLEERGEDAFAEFRTRGSKWFSDDTYFFAWTTDGTRVLHATEPEGEGQNVAAMTDILGRPVGRMILDAAAAPLGEGWVHYMHPRPGSIFPSWKSTYVKRVTFPSGTPHVVGCGIYDMAVDRTLIQDVVNRAANLIAARGRDAFPLLRAKTGPFVFMDTYVFVEDAQGTELVNPAFPILEGMNLLALKDLRGKFVVKEEIEIALRDGNAWLEYYWYRPGSNVPGRKETFVRKVESAEETFIVGSGIYVE